MPGGGVHTYGNRGGWPADHVPRRSEGRIRGVDPKICGPRLIAPPFRPRSELRQCRRVEHVVVAEKLLRLRSEIVLLLITDQPRLTPALLNLDVNPHAQLQQVV